MSECKIDHSLIDVQKKYEDQKELLPHELVLYIEAFFKTEQSQNRLNDVFHLLKKYDLVNEEERRKRDEQMLNILR
jgi:hypothetical protein